jgi:magnesium transporter
LWFDDPWLGVCIGGAMTLTLAVAGLVGTVVPLLSNRLKIDPAVSSAVVITTITDVVGFFSFLGLATLLLL